MYHNVPDNIRVSQKNCSFEDDATTRFRYWKHTEKTSWSENHYIANIVHTASPPCIYKSTVTINIAFLKMLANKRRQKKWACVTPSRISPNNLFEWDDMVALFIVDCYQTSELRPICDQSRSMFVRFHLQLNHIQLGRACPLVHSGLGSSKKARSESGYLEMMQWNDCPVTYPEFPVHQMQVNRNYLCDR